jgi:hypothetical protein
MHRRRRHKREARDALLRDVFANPAVRDAVPAFVDCHDSPGLPTLPPDAASLPAPAAPSLLPIAWASLPAGLDPACGDLPAARAARKRAQLESLVHVVSRVCRPGDRIVEFGAGTGHLGLLLAFLLPRCRVVLVERLAYRAELAQVRAARAGLGNVELLCMDAQQFIDDAVAKVYVTAAAAAPAAVAAAASAAAAASTAAAVPGAVGTSDGGGGGGNAVGSGRSFDVGVGLHCCGSLTDVRLKQALTRDCRTTVMALARASLAGLCD